MTVPLSDERLAQVRVRFLRRIEPLEGGCWRWTGHCCRGGYGVFSIDHKNRMAHRVAYQLFVGEIPDGLVMDHFRYPQVCIGPACVNPQHLRAVTSRENTLRGETIQSANLAKTHCIHGHPFDDANTYWKMEFGAMRRVCRVCQRAAGAAYRARQKALS